MPRSAVGNIGHSGATVVRSPLSRAVRKLVDARRQYDEEMRMAQEALQRAEICRAVIAQAEAEVFDLGGDPDDC